MLSRRRFLAGLAITSATAALAACGAAATPTAAPSGASSAPAPKPTAADAAKPAATTAPAAGATTASAAAAATKPAAGATTAAPSGSPAAAATPAAQTQAAAASGDPIVFGVGGPLTGDNAEYGRIWKQAIDLAVDEINGAGGVKGRKIQIVYEDTQSDPKQSVPVAQKFVADRRIVAEIGDFASPASMAASPIYERGGLVQYAFTSSHPDFTKGGQYMFTTAVSQKDDAPYLANFAVKDLGKKKLALLHLNTDWGKTTADLFEARAKELGAQIALRDAFLPTEKDFRPILNKVRGTEPDAMIIEAYYNESSLLLQQAKDQNMKLPVFANGAVYSPQFLKLGADAVEGVYTASPWFPEAPRPEVQTFVKAYKARYKDEEPNWFAASAYETVRILAHVIDKVGTDRKAIRDGLAALKDYPSIVYGKLTFNEERRIADFTENKLVVKGGKFVLWQPGA
jgi:branched-chain amino acid transport system substrate-binding protein